MRIIIDGEGYSLSDSVGGAHLGDLMALKLQSRTADFAGVTVPSIQKMFKRLGETVSDDMDAIELLADDDFLRNIIGVMFLARRKAGEELTYQKASEIAFSDFSFDFSDEETPDPKDEPEEEVAPS